MGDTLPFRKTPVHPRGMTSSDAAGLRAFRDSLKKNQHLVRGAVLHAGQPRPLDNDCLALPWRWIAAAG